MRGDENTSSQFNATFLSFKKDFSDISTRRNELGVNPTFENHRLPVNAVEFPTIAALMAFLPKSELAKKINYIIAKEPGNAA